MEGLEKSQRWNGLVSHTIVEPVVVNGSMISPFFRPIATTTTTTMKKKTTTTTKAKIIGGTGSTVVPFRPRCSMFQTALESRPEMDVVVVVFLFVRLEVLHHVVLPDESLAAIITGVRLFAGVEAQVPPKVSFVVELLGTYLALVWLVTGVLLQVLRVQVLEGEPLTALIAFERLVARVEALVVLRQVASLVEYLVAFDALVKAVLGNVVRAGVGTGHLVFLGDHGTALRFVRAALLELSADVRVQLLLPLDHRIIARQIVVRLVMVPGLVKRVRQMMMGLKLVLLDDHTVRVRLHVHRCLRIHIGQGFVSGRRSSIRDEIRFGRFERSFLGRRHVLLRI